MLKLLGKLFILCCLVSLSYAARAYISSDSVSLGDRVVLILKADGSSVEFPKITEIAGFEVISTSQSQNIQNINGNITKSIQKEYHFYPSKSIEIPSYTIKVDGKVEKTEQISLHVKKLDTKDISFFLDAKVSNQNPYQNEGVKLSFIFKIKKSIQVMDLRFAPPSLSAFWVKEGKKSKPKEDGEYIIQEINYIIFPQKSGVLDINPARIDIGLERIGRDMFNMLSRSVTYKRISSEKISLHVKPLSETKYVGEFDIKLELDKTKISANENLNAVLKIGGYGNFDDIDEVEIITDANIFRDKAKIKTNVQNDRLVGIYEQKISLSSDKDFTIEPIEFRYFSKEENRLKIIKTKALHVSVDSSNIEKEIFIKSSTKQEPKIIIKELNSYSNLVYGFILGVLFSLLTFILYKYRKIFKYKKIDDEKELIKRLLVIDNEKAKDYIKRIEEYLYSESDTPLNKKEINRFIKSCEE